MPIYEYRCPECDRRYEEWVMGDRRPTCPDCGAPAGEPELSVFAARAGTASEPAPVTACGSCGDPRGPGSCRFDG